MRRAPIILGVVGGLVGLVIAVLLYRGYGAQEVNFGPRGFTVQSDAVVRIEFEVDKDAAAVALCTVRARDRTGLEAGNALVRVGPSADRSQIVTYDLTTRSRAVSGEITACTLERAAAPRTG